MKILLLTPSIKNYGSEQPLPKSQPQNFWVQALNSLGHQVEIFRYTDPSLYPPTRLDHKLPQFSPESIFKNMQLFNLFSKYRPQFVFISAGSWIISPKTIKKIAQKSKIILFSGVSPIEFNSTTEIKYLPFTSLVVTNDNKHSSQWKKLGATKVVTLPISAISPKFINSIQPSKQLKSDLVIVATLFQPRQTQLETIIKTLPSNLDLKIWGWIPPKTSLSPTIKPFYHGEAWGQKLIQIYKSTKIGLNLAPSHMKFSGNIRTFEIPASGALLLSDKLNPNWYTHQVNAICFTNLNQVGELSQKLLANPKLLSKIATAGQKHTFKHHTYQRRFQKLLTLL